jgi:hypothetical protein
MCPLAHGLTEEEKAKLQSLGEEDEHRATQTAHSRSNSGSGSAGTTGGPGGKAGSVGGRSETVSDSEEEDSDGELDAEADSSRQSLESSPRLSMAQLQAIVPKDYDGNLTSLGSVLHLTGKCKPCVEFSLKSDGQSSLGCRHGYRCRYCHFPHKLNRTQKRGRPSKGQRGVYREFRLIVKGKIAEDPLGFDLEQLEMPDWLARNHTLLSKFMKGMQAECESARAAHLARRKNIVSL